MLGPLLFSAPRRHQAETRPNIGQSADHGQLGMDSSIYAESHSQRMISSWRLPHAERLMATFDSNTAGNHGERMSKPHHTVYV